MATRYRHRKDHSAQLEALAAPLAALRQAWSDPMPAFDDAPSTRGWVQQQQPELAAAIERVLATWDEVAVHASGAAVQREQRRREQLVTWVLDMLALLAWGWRR